MIDCAKLAGEVIARLRALSRKTTPEMVRLDINEVVNEVLSLIRREIANHQVMVRLDLAAPTYSTSLPPIFSDRVQLQQVILNLLVNGIQAMAVVRDRPRELLIRTQEDNTGQILVEVRDSGIGIDPEHVGQLFNAFFTTSLWLILGDGVNQVGGIGFWRDFNSVLEFDTLDDFRQLVLTLQSSPSFRRKITSLKTMRRAVSCDNAPFMRTVRCLTVANTLSMGFVRAQVVPVIGGEVEERQQRRMIFDQAFDRLVGFGAYFSARMSRSPSPLLLDPAPARLRAGLCALVENVQRLVRPAALVARGRRQGAPSRAFQKPSAPSPTATSGGDRQAARLQIDEQFLPTLCALPHAGPETDQLLALGRRANQHQHALACGPSAPADRQRRRPHVNVAACRQIALSPPPILVFPLALEPGDHRRREVRRVLAEQGRENLLKIARRNPAQIESRQERVEALRSVQPPIPPGKIAEVKRMRSPAAGAARSRAFGFLHFDRADPGLDRANRIMSVANYALAAVRKGRDRSSRQETYRIDQPPGNQPTSAGSQNFGERIIDLLCSGVSETTRFLVHGVTLLGDLGGLVTNPVTPPSSPRHPVSSIAPSQRRRMAWAWVCRSAV